MPTTRTHYVAVTTREHQLRWLRDVLAEIGEVVVADTETPERVLQLTDAVSASAVLLEISAETLSRQLALLKKIHQSKPLLPVIAISDNITQDLLLSAMRGGAADFLCVGAPAAETVEVVNRVSRQAASNAGGQEKGRLYALISARQSEQTPFLALHLAIAMQAQEGRSDTLLLDLGMPAADCLLFVGQSPTYTFLDALRSLRRFDETLIETAFVKHPSGLRILSMPEDLPSVQDITAADIFVLLGILRTYFRNIVINLGGLPQSDFLQILLRDADEIVARVEQTIPSLKHNKTLLDMLAKKHKRPNSIGLVVDRYSNQFPPSADEISEGLGLRLLCTLPSCGLDRIHAISAAKSLFELRPKSPLLTSIRKLAATLSSAESAPEKVHGGRASLQRIGRQLTALLTGR